MSTTRFPTRARWPRCCSQRSSISGVNLDEEMTNLMQYQKAYQASAELITTVNQMLETVISMKTV